MVGAIVSGLYKETWSEVAGSPATRAPVHVHWLPVPA